mmetsp:Transcript_4374/g.27873  ORF Transcript_4374/g.27873 Transcript_4374/m.27873 type:complete len:210 (-) Transcript_4374:1847-2476(-)
MWSSRSSVILRYSTESFFDTSWSCLMLLGMPSFNRSVAPRLKKDPTRPSSTPSFSSSATSRPASRPSERRRTSNRRNGATCVARRIVGDPLDLCRRGRDRERSTLPWNQPERALRTTSTRSTRCMEQREKILETEWMQESAIPTQTQRGGHAKHATGACQVDPSHPRHGFGQCAVWVPDPTPGTVERKKMPWNVQACIQRSQVRYVHVA